MENETFELMRSRRERILAERAKTQDQKNDDSFLPWFIRSLKQLDAEACRANTVTLTPEFQLEEKHIIKAREWFPDISVQHNPDNSLVVSGFMDSVNIRLVHLKHVLKRAESSPEEQANRAAVVWMGQQINAMTEEDILRGYIDAQLPQDTTPQRVAWAANFHQGFVYTHDTNNNTVRLSGWL